MDEHLHDDLVADIRICALKIDGVIATEKCFVRKMGMHFIVYLHVIVHGELSVTMGHTIAHQVKNQLIMDIPDISDIHIHVEPGT
jgi:divalent metal cation (Fe/Co/Zn/Cd) transporter